MYCAKQRASEPDVITLLATSQLGSDTLVRPEALASAAIPLGVMSPEPTICSALMLSLTVLAPLDSHVDRRGAERDQDGCRDIPSDFQCLTHLFCSLRVTY